MPAPRSVGRELRRLRDAAGMTLAELSRRTGVREAYLAAIEDDREEPSAAALRRIVRQLEPADASHQDVAGLLTAPELNVAGDYAVEVGAGRASTPEPDHAVTAASTGAEPRFDTGDLQFDRVIPRSISAAPSIEPTVVCAGCQASIDTEYFDVNGKTVCSPCRTAIEVHASTPRGVRPVLVAAVLGLGAGIVGAMIYYAVIAIANLEIGIVAVLIGYMVGHAVRTGAGGRGGRRFQILAVALTYASIALAYLPVAVSAVKARQAAQNAVPASAGSRAAVPTVSRPAAATKPSAAKLLLGLAVLLAVIASLPVLVIFGSLPSGLISAIIMFVGMRQAWRMTGAPVLQIFGPYRVGAASMPAVAAATAAAAT